MILLNDESTWKLYRTAMLISTSAWSFQREDVFLVSKPIFIATSYKQNRVDIEKQSDKRTVVT